MLCFVVTPGRASFNTCRNFTRAIPVFSCKNINRHSLPANHFVLTWHITLLNLWSKYLEGTIHSRLQKAKQWLPLEFMEGISDSCETESSGLRHYWGEESYFLQHANVFSGTRKLRLFSFLYVISWELPLYSTCQLKLHLWICTLVTPCPNAHVKKTKLVRGKVET